MQPDTLSSICLLDVVLIEALYVKKNGRSKLKDSDDQSRFDEIFRSPGPMKDETGRVRDLKQYRTKMIMFYTGQRDL
jgi:hypothetical protein